jgi:hypothetical protein
LLRDAVRGRNSSKAAVYFGQEQGEVQLTRAGGPGSLEVGARPVALAVREFAMLYWTMMTSMKPPSAAARMYSARRRLWVENPTNFALPDFLMAATASPSSLRLQ